MYGKPLSMQHKKKISQSNMGKITHNKGKKGYTNKGSFKKGRKISEEARRKLKGRIPWNKGKKGVQVSWNKGTKGLMVAWNKGLKLKQINGRMLNV